MNVRFFRLTTWVAVGHAVAAALFWAFLNVPESSVPMLALSALTLAACALVAGLTETTAIRAAAGGVGWRAALFHGVRRWPAFLVGLALFLAAWWLTGRVFGWHQAHRGEIARLGGRAPSGDVLTTAERQVAELSRHRI